MKSENLHSHLIIFDNIAKISLHNCVITQISDLINPNDKAISI